MRIRSKYQFLELYIAGVLGNRFEVWTDYRDAIAANAFVGFREIGNAGGGKFEMALPEQIEAVARRWMYEGRKFYLNAGDYTIQKKATIQGEICNLVDGWHGFTGPAHEYKMRDMFKRGLATAHNGLHTRHILRNYLCPNSLDDVDALLDLYPEATIEFTSYKCDVGILPNRNTIIWEVRNY